MCEPLRPLRAHGLAGGYLHILSPFTHPSVRTKKVSVELASSAIRVLRTPTSIGRGQDIALLLVHDGQRRYLAARPTSVRRESSMEEAAMQVCSNHSHKEGFGPLRGSHKQRRKRALAMVQPGRSTVERSVVQTSFSVRVQRCEAQLIVSTPAENRQAEASSVGDGEHGDW